MNGFTAFKYYQAIKLHFTSDLYDVFEQKGRVKCSVEAFEKRKDKYLFEKLSRKFKSDKELIQYFASNFMYGNSDVIYNSTEADRNYITFLKRKQSITNVFNDDLSYLELENSDKSIFDCSNNQIPIIITYLINKKITLETLSILNHINHNIDKIDNSVILAIYGDTIRQIRKSTKFIKFDIQKILPIYMEKFKDG